ncbi:hypothetical protein [Kingella kingae]|uniref:hypothetical protein n=1 Tax=Kingella kingae TaxID=504 RepID=UPI0005718964|nr:hypothetical protein [Kingella kingae]
MEVEKNQVVPTDHAIQVIGHLRQNYPNAVNPIVTAQWEQKLAQMAKGQCAREQFMAETESMVREFVTAMQSQKMPNANGSNGVQASCELTCPCCSAGVDEYAQILYLQILWFCTVENHFKQNLDR